MKISYIKCYSGEMRECFCEISDNQHANGLHVQPPFWHLKKTFEGFAYGPFRTAIHQVLREEWRCFSQEILGLITLGLCDRQCRCKLIVIPINPWLAIPHLMAGADSSIWQPIVMPCHILMNCHLMVWCAALIPILRK